MRTVATVHQEGPLSLVGPVGPLLGLVLEAQGRASGYVHAEGIATAASVVVKQARELGQPLLMAASPLADRLIGAAAVDGGNGMRVADMNAGVSGAHVLVLDVAVASPLSLERAARYARGMGADRVDALVVSPVGDTFDWAVPSAGRLRVG